VLHILLLVQVFPWVLQLCDKAVAHVNSSSSNASSGEGKPAAAAACIDVEDLSKRFTADVIGRMLFAEDLGSMDMRYDSSTVRCTQIQGPVITRHCVGQQLHYVL
jgi:hypothetical protein